MDDIQMTLADKQQQIQQQQQAQQQTREQRHMHRHLVGLQNWDLVDNQTMEQRRMEQNNYLMEEELQRNADTRKFWKKKCKLIDAERTAEGRPAQIQKPAKKTFKQRREDKRLDESAKEVSPLADHISVHMLESLQKEQRMQANSITPELFAEAERQDVDRRVLRNFVYGYEKDQNGEPVDEYQRSRKEVDQRFLEDYISKDAQRRKPHLDRMLDQVLSIDITEEMLEPEYMEYHAGELHEQVSRLVYFDNVFKDPVNRAYFDALPQIKKDLIECRVRDRYALYGQLFTHLCALRGVKSDGAQAIRGNEEDARHDRESYGPLVEAEKQLLREGLAETRQRERTLLQNEFERMYAVEKETLIRGGEQMKQMADEQQMKTDKGADMSNLEFTGFVTGYSFDELAKYRKMIEDHPQEYREDAELIDALYQQMYRSLDSLGDFKLETMASQGVIDELSVTMLQQSKLKSALQKKAEIRLTEASMKSEIIMRQINGMADALTALLEHERLSGPARQMIRQLGYYRK